MLPDSRQVQSVARDNGLTDILQGVKRVGIDAHLVDAGLATPSAINEDVVAEKKPALRGP
jgi:hypothetical protein